MCNIFGDDDDGFIEENWPDREMLIAYYIFTQNWSRKIMPGILRMSGTSEPYLPLIPYIFQRHRV